MPLDPISGRQRRRAHGIAAVYLFGAAGCFPSFHDLAGGDGIEAGAITGSPDGESLDGKPQESASGLYADAPQSDAADFPDVFVDIPSRQLWSATASSMSNCCKDTIESAFDGDLSTRWSTGKAQAGDEWYRLDIGAVAEMSEVSLESLADVPGNGSEYPRGYILELSIDDTNYVDVANGMGTSLTRITFARRAARYVKIKQTGSAGSWWSIHELTLAR